MTVAVCYIATDGYLFQTVVSALQARSMTGEDVHVAHLGDAQTPEARTFRKICNQANISFRSFPSTLINGLHPVFARFWLDVFLGSEYDSILYVDGDTQIVGPLDPLLQYKSAYPFLAARDPMVLIRDVHTQLRIKIDSWWDLAEMGEHRRANYANAGVMRLAVTELPRLRSQVLSLVQTHPALPFADQDAFNIIAGGETEILSSAWNFPGFWLRTPMAAATELRIIHFMSSPRPWSGASINWDSTYMAPYELLAAQHPASRPYWIKHGLPEALKYRLQSLVKARTEQRTYSRPSTLVRYSELEDDSSLR